ncbi:MAG: TonB-dependent receptor [bacterium]|nr:TonB-dependent receptor [bacterium]
MNMTKNITAVLLLLLLFAFLTPSFPLWAGDQKNEDDVSFREILEMSLEELLELPITVSSTKGETLLRSSSTVTILDREMLERFNFRDLASAIEFIGGVDVYRTYFNQHLVTVRRILQDGYTNKNLLMIDNVPTFASVAGETTFDRIHLEDVERIEILKGPASVLYGSQAYTGAFNVVLRQPGKNGWSLDFNSGVGNHRGNAFRGGFRIKKNRLSAMVSVSSTGGQRHAYSFSGENGEVIDSETYIDSRMLTASLSYGSHKFLLNIYRHYDDFLGVTPSRHRGAGEIVLYEGLLAAYRCVHQWDEKFQTRSQVYYDWNVRDYPRDNIVELHSHAAGFRLGGNIRNLLSLNKKLHLETGAEYDYRKSDELSNYLLESGVEVEDNNMKDKAVYEYSIYGQLEWNLDPFLVVAGGRFTGNEFFGGNLSTRMTLVYAVNKANSLKLIVGQSYRSPNLFELNFMTAQKTIFGNPDLNPETSDVIELVYQYGKRRFFIQASGFLAGYKNKIFRKKGDAYDPDGNFHRDVNVYANGEPFTSYGLELECKYLHPESVNVYLNASYISGNDGDRVFDERESYGLPGTYYYNFKCTPRLTVSGGIHKNWGRFGTSARFSHVGETDGPYLPVPGHTLVDLEFNYQHRFNGFLMKHNLSVSNVLGHEVWYPEYVRRRIVNSVPGSGKTGIFYSISVSFTKRSRGK